MVAITTLPGAPALVEGVIDVRGTLVPVLSLRARLGRAVTPPSIDEHLVLLQATTRTIACRVDRASDLVTLDDASLAPPSGLVASARGIAGVAATADGLVVVHDVDAFLDEAETLALDAALA